MSSSHKIRKGRGKSTATRCDLVLWSSSGESAVSSQLEDKEIKPSNLFLVYIHPLSYFFLFPLQMSYNYIQNITDICSTFFGHTLFVILDSSLLGSALIHRVSTSELHRATLPTPICSPIAWHFYLKKHGAGIFRRMLCYGVRCFRHGMNCLHAI